MKEKISRYFQILTGALLVQGIALNAQWVAFNDMGPGPGTAANTTTFSVGTRGGGLKNSDTGAPTGAGVSISAVSPVTSPSQGPPAFGPPAYIVFDGYVDFAGSPNLGVELNTAAAVLTYSFSGLDPTAEYNFQGTGIRGEPTYTDRWTLFEIGGARSFTSAHSPGTLTTAQVSAITAAQVAINTGDNTQGRLAWWEHIQPSLSGTFTVTCTKYLGTVPGGSSGGVKGYGMTGFRLENAGVYSGRTNVPPIPPKIPSAEVNHINGIKTVFIILMENHDWSTIKNSPNCPYINNTLLPMASYATQYYTPPSLHPSEPNYLWLISGTNFGIRNDNPPVNNHQSSTNNLFTQLDRANISWKTYQENIPGNTVPDANATPYAVRHNPFVFFDQVRNNLQYCTNHVRPYPELARDLTNNTVPRFNFITPNVTNDMHDLTPGSASTRIQGDTWLKAEVPKILNSAAYTNGGLLIITWDEGGGNSDGPIGLIVLSPRAKGGGYNNSIHYTHSTTVRTIQDIFGLRPYLAEAAYSNTLTYLFKTPQIIARVWHPSSVQLTITNLVPNRTNLRQACTDLSPSNWVSIKTSFSTGTSQTLTDNSTPQPGRRFYRVVELP